jgi:hypothetical protein
MLHGRGGERAGWAVPLLDGFHHFEDATVEERRRASLCGGGCPSATCPPLGGLRRSSHDQCRNGRLWSNPETEGCPFNPKGVCGSSKPSPATKPPNPNPSLGARALLPPSGSTRGAAGFQSSLASSGELRGSRGFEGWFQWVRRFLLSRHVPLHPGLGTEAPAHCAGQNYGQQLG